MRQTCIWECRFFKHFLTVWYILIYVDPWSKIRKRLVGNDLICATKMFILVNDMYGRSDVYVYMLTNCEIKCVKQIHFNTSTRQFPLHSSKPIVHVVRARSRSKYQKRKTCYNTGLHNNCLKDYNLLSPYVRELSFLLHIPWWNFPIRSSGIEIVQKLVLLWTPQGTNQKAISYYGLFAITCDRSCALSSMYWIFTFMCQKSRPKVSDNFQLILYILFALGSKQRYITKHLLTQTNDPKFYNYKFNPSAFNGAHT